MNIILENPIIFIILTTIFTVVCTYLVDTLILNKKQEEKEGQPEETQQEPLKATPKVSYNDLMAILDATINRELYFWIQLNVNMKDVKIIDFTENVELLSRRIADGLSKEFMEDITYYHKQTWVMRYIVRTVKIYVTDYIRKHPIS